MYAGNEKCIDIHHSLGTYHTSACLSSPVILTRLFSHHIWSFRASLGQDATRIVIHLHIIMKLVQQRELVLPSATVVDASI